MKTAPQEKVIITPCRTRSRLQQSLEELGVSYIRSGSTRFDHVELRAKYRSDSIAARHQRNIESIVSLALDRSERVTSISEPDPDWLELFLTLAEKTSNPRMQELWARVLLIETRQPSSFSIRTLRVLAELSAYETSILKRAKSLTALDRKSGRHKILVGYQQRPGLLRLLKPSQVQINLGRCGLSYPDLLALMELGIIHQDLIETGLLERNQALQLSWSGTKAHLIPLANELIVTYFKYTGIGEELCRLIITQPNQEYLAELEQAFSAKYLLQYE